jgi:hypothetical protein
LDIFAQWNANCKRQPTRPRTIPYPSGSAHSNCNSLLLPLNTQQVCAPRTGTWQQMC